MSVADQSASPAKVARRLPFTVRVSPQFLNRVGTQIQRAAGKEIEIAGLLFGNPEDALVYVHTFKSFPQIDSKAGPPSQRNHRDEFFYSLMLASRTDPELAGFDLIGWYAVRGTGGLHQSDIEFHERHFRRPSDIALILRSEREHHLLELYTRSADGRLSPEEHRSGALRVSTATPVTCPVEIAMRASISDDFYLRAYEVGKSLDRAERKEQWKSTVQSTKKIALSVLWPKRTKTGTSGDPEPSQPEGTSADAVIRRQLKTGPVQETEEPATPKSETHTKALSTQRLDAAIVRRAQQDAYEASPVFPLSVGLQRIHAEEPPGLPAVIPHPKERRVPWLSSAIVFVLVAAATFGVVLLYGLPTGTGLPEFLHGLLPSTGLRLRAEGQGDRVLLSWNRLNPIVRSAKEGILQIVDGSQRREVRLDAGQVANGSVLYRPASGDVTFRLEVHGEHGAIITESMRVLDGEKSQPVDSAGPKPSADLTVKTDPYVTASQAESVPVSSAGERIGLPSSKSRSTRDTSPVGSGIPAGALSPASTDESTASTSNGANASKPVVPDSDAGRSNQENTFGGTASPSQLKSSDTASALLSPSALQEPVSPTGSDSKVASWEMPAAPEPTSSEKADDTHPAKVLPAQNPAESGVALTESHGSTPRDAAATDYVAPVPIRQVLPDLRAFAPAITALAQEIEIEVIVDKNGHIQDAKIARESGKVKASLAHAALVAAKQWTFQPARLHGIPVVSDHTIVFQFHPAAR